ncbi:MAG: DUF2075 domain-containing protein [Planctomycetes bacterium]|nr:DUF2075 domain-containing protein [Planctomycetota bacterium]
MSSGVLIKLSDLLKGDKDWLLGRLSSEFEEQGWEEQRTSQTAAWRREIEHMKGVAENLIAHDPSFADWRLLLEYEIPRRQKHPDGILLDSDIIFVIEFKLGERRAGSGERWQTEEYALDLRDFHAASREKTIIPILCLEREAAPSSSMTAGDKGIVLPVQVCGIDSLAERIILLHDGSHDPSEKLIDAELWRAAPYRPSLTIIEAAERLFAHHDVREISHSYADNLTEATSAVVEHIRESQRACEHRICFVTGVPGAGKTLTGLNAVHDPQLRSEGRPPAVFLSGNGPLVKVVKCALVRSCQDQNVPRIEAQRRVSAFIQNVHSFVRHYSANADSPATENVIVFDEAQRAWDARKMAKKHKQAMSEPELVLQIMERCAPWSVIIALVGGGQEIHEGEAGLSEWGAALSHRAIPWTVAASQEALHGGQSVAGQRLFIDGSIGNVVLREDARLHLRVSTRSWRAHRFNEWVNEVLANHPTEARGHLPASREFPVVVTRDVNTAREWLRVRSGLEPNHDVVWSPVLGRCDCAPMGSSCQLVSVRTILIMSGSYQVPMMCGPASGWRSLQQNSRCRVWSWTG